MLDLKSNRRTKLLVFVKKLRENLSLLRKNLKVRKDSTSIDIFL